MSLTPPASDFFALGARLNRRANVWHNLETERHVTEADDSRLQKALDRLEEEAERIDGPVPYDDVLRLGERCGVPPDRLQELFAALSDLGIDIIGVPGAPPNGREAQPEPEPDRAQLAALEKSLLTKAKRHRLLSAAEERNLTRRVRAGIEAKKTLASAETKPPDPSLVATVKDSHKARQTMVECNQGLVRFVAGSFRQMGNLSFDDLVGEGQLGLLRAIDKFDPSLGYRFSTYATWWIIQAISRGIADKGRTIRLPAHLQEKQRALRKAKRALERANEGREATPYELAEYMNLPLVKIVLLLNAVKEPVSLDASIEQSQGATVKDALVAREQPGPEDLASVSELRVAVAGVLNGLDPKLKKVIERRFGLRADHDETLQEIGDDMGVTRERIRQIESKALDKLRHRVRAKVLAAHVDDEDTVRRNTPSPTPLDGAENGTPRGMHAIRKVGQHPAHRKRKG
jgi:RNA polymerase primary sigma factor